MILALDAGVIPSEPEQLWSYFDVLNIACDDHALMARAVAFSLALGIKVGVLPGYPDGHGRAIDEDDLAAAIAAQCGVLAGYAGSLYAVRARGALYADAARDPAIARALLDGAHHVGIVIGPQAGALRDLAFARGLPYWVDATIAEHDDAGPRARALDGHIDALCVPGDAPHALAIARDVYAAVRG